MSLNDQFQKDSDAAIQKGLSKEIGKLFVPQSTELSSDLLARQLMIQIEILKTLERIEEKLK